MDVWRASLTGRVDELLRGLDRLHAELCQFTTMEELSINKHKLASVVKARNVWVLSFVIQYINNLV